MELKLCKKEQNDLNCAIDCSLLVFCIILFILNVSAAVKMCCFIKAIKFEILVILSGMIQSIILIFIIFTNYEIFSFTVMFLQVFIYLYILRRFLRIYYQLKKQDHDSVFYNRFFIVNSGVNIIFLITLVISSLYLRKENEIGPAFYIELAFTIFSLYVGVVLFIIGTLIKNMINSSIQEINADYLNSIRDNSENNNVSMIISSQRKKSLVESNSLVDSRNEIYYRKRKIQVNLIIYISLLSDLYNVFYLLCKYIIFNDHFEEIHNRLNPRSTLAIIIHGIFLLFLILQIALNYFAFFFIIRDYYEQIKTTDQQDFRTESFVRLSHSGSNDDIDSFLYKKNEVQ